MDAPQWTGDDDRDVGCSEQPLTCPCPFCVDWRAQQDDLDDEKEQLRSQSGGDA